MREIVLTLWVSLDGYSSGPENDMSFVGESFNPEMAAYEHAIVDTADTLLLGRVTYESFAGSWPHVPDSETASEEEKGYARKLNAMRKIAFSRTLASADWNNSTLVRSISADELRALKGSGPSDKAMLIYGSASIVQQLTALRLIHECQLLVHPVVLGRGKSLFGEMVTRQRLALVEAPPFESGVVLITYRPRED